jgi:hypothetical protein
MSIVWIRFHYDITHIIITAAAAAYAKHSFTAQLKVSTLWSQSLLTALIELYVVWPVLYSKPLPIFAKDLQNQSNAILGLILTAKVRNGKQNKSSAKQFHH